MNLVTTKEYGEKYILTVTFDKDEWKAAQEKAFKISAFPQKEKK